MNPRSPLAPTEPLGRAYGNLDAPSTCTRQLSFAQERLWLLEQIDAPNAADNLPVAHRFRGRLDVDALTHGLNELVARHAILRTTFDTRDGHPVQLIAEPRTLPLSGVDLSHLPEAERERALLGVLARESRRPFDTRQGPLTRAVLVRLDDVEHALLLTLHRLVCDDRSLDLLASDLNELYAARVEGRPASLPEPVAPYVDYAASQRERSAGADLDRLLANWRSQLEGAPLVLELPSDRPRTQSALGRSECISFRMPTQLVSALRDLSVQHAVTLEMTLLAGFGTLLGRYARQEDVLIGTTVTGRVGSEAAGLVGPLADTLVLRVDLSGNPSFAELLSRVRDMTLFAEGHRELPFAKLVEVLRPRRGFGPRPVVQVMFGLNDARLPVVQPVDVDSTLIELQTSTSRVDLDLALSESETGIDGRLLYDVDLFDRATIERVVAHYEVLLDSAAADALQPISELPLMRESERRQVLVDWNAPQIDYPRDRCLNELVEAQVDRTPHMTAVVAGAQTLSYVELDSRANQLAHYLRDQGIGRGDLIALHLDRTADMLIALLAICKAGAGYVPLDPSYPLERRAFVLADCGARLLLTQSDLLTGELGAALQVVCLDHPDQQAAISARPKTRPNVVASPDDVAYVIYTSGSTGRPKGVPVPHRAVVNLLAGASRMPGIGAEDAVLSITTLAFDIAVYDLWAPLSVGARIVLASRDTAADVGLLADLLRTSGATIMQATPATWRILLEAGWRGGSGLKIVSTGEALPRDLAVELARRSNDVWNMYGPTETTVWSTYWRVPSQPGLVLIGRPMANTRVYVLDGSGQLVPVGIPGELHIGGDGVAKGYLGRPELTAERFVRDPFASAPGARMYRTGDIVRWRLDGQLEYLGRNDHQVKLRGYRIEPGEIEVVLREHPLVRDAGVIVRQDARGERQLVAYTVSTESRPPARAAELRTFIRQRLPEYMVPSAFVALDVLPRTVNGKLDRETLATVDPATAFNDEGYVGPRDTIERQLVVLWQELLGPRPIGINDNFFDIGGHSLLAAELVFRIKDELGRNLPVATLIRADTVAQLADLIRAPERDDIWDPLVELQPGEPGCRPLFLVHGAFGDVLCYSELARALGPQQACYVLQAIGLDGVHPPQERIEDMASSYIQQMRTVQPVGPYCLAGYSLGGIIVYEMAHQLKAKGEEVALLAVFDHPPSVGWSNQRALTVTFWARFAQNLVANLPHWARMARRVDRGSWTMVFRERAALSRRAFSNLLSAKVPSVEEAMREVEEMNGLTHLADWPDHRRRVLECQFRAMFAYEVQPYEGGLVLFRARRQPLVSPHDPQLGWGGLIHGRVDVIRVPGNHQDLLHEPYVQTIAAGLRARLEALAG